MSQQALHHRDLHAGFQQMGRKGMAQAVNSALAGQARSFDRPFIDPLPGVARQGNLPITPKEEPLLRLKHPPVATQLLEQARREHGAAILAPLALFHPNLHPLAVNVSRLQMTGLSQPQPGTIHRHQKSPVLGMQTPDRQEPLQLLRTVNLRPPDRLGRPGQHWLEMLRSAVQDQVVKEPQPAHRHIEGAGRQLPLPRQVEQVILQLVVRNLVGRLAVILGQTINRSHIGPLGLG